jgi:hypothetical protein
MMDTIDRDAFDSLREALDSESISLGELILIESVFDTIPDDKLRDQRENAMAGDMLDEIEANGLVLDEPEVVDIGLRKVLDCE